MKTDKKVERELSNDTLYDLYDGMSLEELEDLAIHTDNGDVRDVCNELIRLILIRE